MSKEQFEEKAMNYNNGEEDLRPSSCSNGRDYICSYIKEGTRKRKIASLLVDLLKNSKMETLEKVKRKIQREYFPDCKATTQLSKDEKNSKIHQIEQILTQIKAIEESNELLAIDDCLDINWNTLANVVNIELGSEQLEETVTADALRHLWTTFVQPKLLETSITIGEEKLLQKLIMERQIANKFKKYFPNRATEWINQQIKRYQLETNAALKTEDIERFTKHVSQMACDFNDQDLELLEKFPDYSYFQLKTLYNNVPREARRREHEFTREEDAFIISFIECGWSSEEIANNIPQFIHKNPSSIKRQYKKLCEDGIEKEYKAEGWTSAMDKHLMRLLKKKYEKIDTNMHLFPEKTVGEVQRRKKFFEYHEDHEGKRWGSLEEDEILDKLGTFQIRKFRSIKAKLDSPKTKPEKKLKSILRERLQFYCRPYFTKLGRKRSDIRSPRRYLHSFFSRESAMLFARYLNFLKGNMACLVATYNECPGQVMKALCRKPDMDWHVPDSVKHHLVHIIAKESFATCDELENDLPLPPLNSSNENVFKTFYHAPNASTLILSRGLTFHEDYLVRQSIGKWKATDIMPHAFSSEGLSTENSEEEHHLRRIKSQQPRHSPEQSHFLLKKRIEALLVWPLLLKSQSPPINLQPAKEEVLKEVKNPQIKTDNCSNSKFQKNNGKLKKRHLKLIRRKNMVEKCLGKSIVKPQIKEARSKRTYIKRLKTNTTEVRRSTRRKCESIQTEVKVLEPSYVGISFKPSPEVPWNENMDTFTMPDLNCVW